MEVQEPVQNGLLFSSIAHSFLFSEMLSEFKLGFYCER